MLDPMDKNSALTQNRTPRHVRCEVAVLTRLGHSLPHIVYALKRTDIH